MTTPSNNTIQTGVGEKEVIKVWRKNHRKLIYANNVTLISTSVEQIIDLQSLQQGSLKMGPLFKNKKILTESAYNTNIFKVDDIELELEQMAIQVSIKKNLNNGPALLMMSC